MLNPALNLKLEVAENKSIRDAIGIEILNQAENNEDIIVLSADLRESTRVEEFSKKFKERFIEVGVAEQNLAGISAGLALSGKIPIMTSFAVFSPGRNWDQIRVSICYSNANVKIVGGHAGLLTGPDGATHQALEDIAITRVLPNMIVINPLDFEQSRKAIEFAITSKGPVYIRSYRDKTPQITTKNTPFEIGVPQILIEGTDLTILASGPILFEAISASEKLKKEKNISCEVINIHSIKPLDSEIIKQSFRKTKKGVIIEEHQISGGVGSAILENLSEYGLPPIKLIGINNTFGESGEPKDLYEKYGISSQQIYKKILNYLERHF